MWPTVLGQLNLQRMIRNLFGNLILVGIIPAQREGKEPFHLDPYLEVLVDELLCLTDARIYYAYKDEVLNAKVDILIHVLDYQGIGKVFHMTETASYRGCSWCQIKGTFCPHLRKMIYLGNQRYLTSNDPMQSKGNSKKILNTTEPLTMLKTRHMARALQLLLDVMGNMFLLPKCLILIVYQRWYLMPCIPLLCA